MIRWGVAIRLAALLVPASSNAIAPATREQIFCNDSHVVVAEIKSLKTSAEACFNQPTMYCQCSLKMVVEVKAVLGLKNSVSRYPEDVGISIGKEVHLNSRTFQFPPAVLTPRSCSDIEANLLGKESVVSVLTHYGPWSDGTTHVDRPPYWATIWPAEERAWIDKRLAVSNGVNCSSSANVPK